jgi:hypothetical protein
MSRPAKRLAAVPCVDCGRTTRAWSKRCNSCERLVPGPSRRKVLDQVHEGQARGEVAVPQPTVPPVSRSA